MHTDLNSASMLSLVLKLVLHLILMIHTRFQISILHSCHIISLAFSPFFCSLSFLLAEGKSLLFLVLYCFVVVLFSSKETLLPNIVYSLSHLFESLATLFGVWSAKFWGLWDGQQTHREDTTGWTTYLFVPLLFLQTPFSVGMHGDAVALVFL